MSFRLKRTAPDFPGHFDRRNPPEGSVKLGIKLEANTGAAEVMA